MTNDSLDYRCILDGIKLTEIGLPDDEYEWRCLFCGTKYPSPLPETLEERRECVIKHIREIAEEYDRKKQELAKMNILLELARLKRFI